jgi:hypothetical protein
MTENFEQGESSIGLTTDTITADGKIHFHANSTECDYHITARPDYSPKVMRALLEIIRRLGLEPMDDDECEPELLDDGSARIYLVPILPDPHGTMLRHGRILAPFTLPDLVARIPEPMEAIAC